MQQAYRSMVPWPRAWTGTRDGYTTGTVGCLGLPTATLLADLRSHTTYPGNGKIAGVSVTPFRFCGGSADYFALRGELEQIQPYDVSAVFGIIPLFHAVVRARNNRDTPFLGPRNKLHQAALANKTKFAAARLIQWALASTSWQGMTIFE